MRLFNNLEDKISSRHMLKSLAIMYESQAHAYSEPTLEYSQDCLWQIKVGNDLFNHHGSYRNIIQFYNSYRMESRARDTWVIKPLEKFSANNITLLDAEDNTSRPLSRGSTYSRFAFVKKTISHLSKVIWTKFPGSGRVLFC